MADIENVIYNLELNIRWICDNPAHQFPGYGNVEMAMRDALELLKERKRGQWTTHRTQDHDGEWYCDQCGYEPTVFEATPYCPNCGAMMF